MKNIEFSNRYCVSMVSDFITSADYYEKNGNKFVCQSEVPKKTNHSFLLYELLIEYNGKTKTEIDFCNFSLDYNDEYIVNPIENYRTSISGSTWVSSSRGCSFEIDPLEDTHNYIFRGVFEINNEIKDNDSNGLILNLPFDLMYKIR